MPDSTEHSDGDGDPKWEEIALELGRLVIAWSKLEFFVTRVFVGLTGVVNPAETVLVRRLNANTMEQVIGDLLASRPAAEREPLVAWMKRVADLRKARNQLLHGSLVEQYDGDSWLPTLISYQFDRQTGKASFGGPRIVADDLRRLHDHVREVFHLYESLPIVAREGITFPEEPVEDIPIG